MEQSTCTMPMTAFQPPSMMTFQQPSMSPIAPAGLGYLASVDQLLVKQEVEMLEVFSGMETNNRYRIFNSMGQQCFFAGEKSDCLQRQFCGSDRAFTMSIVDNQENEVIYIDRPLTCCLSEMTIYSPRDNVIGYLKENWSCRPDIELLGPDREQLYFLSGPVCICDCFGQDIDFTITRVGETSPIGKISKQWSGYAKELVTKANNFDIQFPIDLDIRHKAILLAATFLIDFRYFEEDDNNNKKIEKEANN